MIAWKIPQLPEPLRRPARWVGYPLFAITMFLLVFYWSLPRDRIRENLEKLCSTWLDADVQAGDFGLTMLTGAGVDASNVSIRSRPALVGDKPVRYVVDDVVVHFGVIDSLRNRTDASFKGHVAGGAVRGMVRINPDEGVFRLDVRGLNVGSLPALSQKIGLPVEGKLEVKVDFLAPKNLASQAGGSLSILLEDCFFGDGKAKLVIPSDPMLAQGITVPRIKLGPLAGSATIEKGRVTIKDMRSHSSDGDVELNGYIELRDPINLSMLHLYLRFKPTDALIRRESSIELLIGQLARAKRADGFYGISITGLLSAPNPPVPSREPPPGVLLGSVGSSSPSAPPRQNSPTVVPGFSQTRIGGPGSSPVPPGGESAPLLPPPQEEMPPPPPGVPPRGGGAPLQTGTPSATPPPPLMRAGSLSRGLEMSPSAGEEIGERKERESERREDESKETERKEAE